MSNSVKAPGGEQSWADYYRALSGAKNTLRLAAGVSRVWVEQYVSQSGSEMVAVADEIVPNSNAWLADVIDDPGVPRLIRPVPARAAHS